ncbi:MAG: hypothetical protein MK135_03155 [Polyangiaceae bacterium]|nr:hypothetical protein [Polyangiaceae bacterium]
MVKRNHSAGLDSLNESRANRRRQLATGKAAIGGIPPRLFGWGMSILIVGGFLYYRNFQSDVDIARSQLMANQRATSASLGPKLIPLRDQVEGLIADLQEDKGQLIDESQNWNEVLSSPSIYLRLQAKDAESPQKIRRAALSSLRDGFSSCFLRGERVSRASSGKSCEKSLECAAGEICNEYDTCQLPSSPFNARLLYRALKVLSDSWLKELEGAKSELSISAYAGTLESVTEVDIPVAIEVYQRAKYLVVVLDQSPEQKLPDSIPGEFESEMTRLQRIPHPAIVGIWDLASKKLIARVQAEAKGELRQVGTRQAYRTALAEAARASQANSCGLAMAVRDRLMTRSPESPESPELEAGKPSNVKAP